MMTNRIRAAANEVVAAAVAVLLFSGSAQAGPEEDYARGRAAFHGDDLFGAMGYLRRAADSGHSGAQTLLAYILDKSEEDAAAFDLYLLAANQGNPDAMFGLASMYASGEGGERKPAFALHWFQAAAERGHAQAMAALAEAHLKGDLGLTADRDRAIELFTQSIAGGYVQARERLASLTEKQP